MVASFFPDGEDSDLVSAMVALARAWAISEEEPDPTNDPGMMSARHYALLMAAQTIVDHIDVDGAALADGFIMQWDATAQKWVMVDPQAVLGAVLALGELTDVDDAVTADAAEPDPATGYPGTALWYTGGQWTCLAPRQVPMYYSGNNAASGTVTVDIPYGLFYLSGTATGFVINEAFIDSLTTGGFFILCNQTASDASITGDNTAKIVCPGGALTIPSNSSVMFVKEGYGGAVRGLGFSGAIPSIPDNSITNAKMADNSVNTAEITNDAVTNAKLANMAQNTIKGRVSSGTGDPEDLTGIQAAGILQGDGLDADAAGFRGIPQNAQTGNYTLVAADAGKHIHHESGAGAGDTYTIPANGTVAFEIGTTVTFTNMDSNAITIAITTDTMYLAGTGTTGSRTLAQYGVATALKVGTTTWIISGTGLT